MSIKTISFSLFTVIAIVLATTTVIEKFSGTHYVQTSIYGAWWFYLLWIVLTISSLIYFYRSNLHKKISTFMLHISFVVILLGAIVTALTAQRGMIYLPVGVTQNSFTDSNNNKIQLPFEITLKLFEIKYYSGTNAAADYMSNVVFSQNGKEVSEKIVSMNKIAKYDGYRFYQSEYDNSGSWLSVNRDIYGIPITYTGYVLLVLSFIILLVSPKGAFRRLLKSPLLQKGMMLGVMCIWATISNAQSSKIPQTLSKEQCKMLEDLQVVYNERVMPLSTLARDFTLKLTGSDNYKDCSYEQFFWGWFFFPTEWENEAIFEVPQSKKQKFLGLERQSAYKDFFTSKNIYKLNHYIRNVDSKKEIALHKELTKLNEKIQLIAMLRSGAMVKIFPYKNNNGKISWYSPKDSLPEEMDLGQSLFIKNSFEMLLSAYASGNSAEFSEIADKIVGYQKKFGEDSLLKPQKVEAERLYFSIPVTALLFRMNLFIGILSVIIIVLNKKKQLNKIIGNILNVDILFSWVLIAIHIALKWYITGRMPLSNGYDTMIFLGLSISTIIFCLRKSFLLFTAMGTTLIGFTMLVATLGGLNPQITQLIPVLNSPFLTTHVCLIMLSYALFAFTFINGIIALTLGRSDKNLLDRLSIYSRIFLILGLVFLAIGIFIGAVWANVSWGRYWAWDPKEVWALITLMFYSLPLHSSSIKIFRNKIVFHIYMIFGIIVVLMTYFGVNLVLGGMHSYVN